MALNDNFGKYIQNDMVAEEIFNLSVRYCDNDCDEEDRNAIWTNIEDIVSSI